MKNSIPVLVLALLTAAGACNREEESPEPVKSHDDAGGHDATGAANGVEERAPLTMSTGAGGMPSGYAEVEIPGDRLQLLGVRTARAERAPLAATIRAAAYVATDETREAHVHSRVMGWVQDIYVNAVGQQVEKGDPLYSIYSQELYAAQKEYLSARVSSPQLAASARRRLELFGVPPDEIARIARDGVRREVIFRSPISGTVLEKDVVKGHFLEPEMLVYRIADLSRVWVLASIYEYEADRLEKGARAHIEVQGVAEPVTGRIDYVYPTVDPVSRTVTVRVVVENTQGLLRPGNYATAHLSARSIDAVWVPEEAVIDTGDRQVVYVALGEGGASARTGRFRPTLVRVGRRVDGRAEILEGISEGTEVVTTAQFLLDSESRLRGASSGEMRH